MVKAPEIDSRSREKIFQILAEELAVRLEVNACTGGSFAGALLQIFSRYSELIIERLNRVPEKNFNAFLDVLKVSRIPPVPARVPLTFTPVKKLPPNGNTIYVPALTKVAAPPGKGEIEPAVFETTRDVMLTNVMLQELYTLDPQRDLYDCKSQLASTREKCKGEFLFSGTQAIPHEFYLAHNRFFSRKEINRLCLSFTLEDRNISLMESQEVQWYIPTPDGILSIRPVKDSTAQLCQSGEVVFNNLPEWPVSEVYGQESRWIACRLLNRMPRETEGPVSFVQHVTMNAFWRQEAEKIDGAYWNNLPLDLSKDFFPFGEMPRFGDVFYLNSSAFSEPNTRILIKIKMTNSASSGMGGPIPPVEKTGDPEIQWEGWNGRHWQVLSCRDTTESLTEDGEIAFTVPVDFSWTAVNGTDGYWIRARLVSGNYGDAGQLSLQMTGPCIQTILLTSSLIVRPEPPECIVTNNNLLFEKKNGSSFSPFHRANQPCKTLYLGFAVPAVDRNALKDTAIDLYFHIQGAENRLFYRAGNEEQAVRLVWQYWNGNNWAELQTDDATNSLSRSGIIRIQTPDDIVEWCACSFRRSFRDKDEDASPLPLLHWLRVLWVEGQCNCRLKVNRILLNTVPAIHTDTISNEVLGSSNGLPNQLFHSARKPLLQEVNLEIVEPKLPSKKETEKICKQEGQEAISRFFDEQSNIEQIRIRWHEVEDFLSSENDDRHFVVDRQNGNIYFGDGITGKIPPSGVNNVRLVKYVIGGGESGNKPAGSIKQLRSSVLYVDSVENLEDAVGGQEIEAWSSLRERGSRTIRHRNRAVTVEDYEDLAKMASPAVAKAKCVPNSNLSIDQHEKGPEAGVISLIVVPYSLKRRPRPDADLLHQVVNFLDARRSPDAQLMVFEPNYLEISIETSVLSSRNTTGGNLVEICQRKLDTFLHPLTGGEHAQGWEFGQMPHESDFYALLESVDGLEAVHSLHITTPVDPPGFLEKGMYLICSGRHTIRIVG